MKNQTAINWLEHNLKKGMNFIEIMGLIRQAKELEKDQIIEAYSNNGWNDEDQRANGEQYYNQTFKKQ
jgi:hypothetical protein